MATIAGTSRADVKLEHIQDNGTASSRTLRYGLAFAGDGLHLLLTEAPIKCDTQSSEIRGWVIGVEADGTVQVMESSSEGASVPSEKVKLSRKPAKGRVAGTIAFDLNARLQTAC